MMLAGKPDGSVTVTDTTELQAASTRKRIQLHKEKCGQESLLTRFPVTRIWTRDPKTNKTWIGERVLMKQQPKERRGRICACFYRRESSDGPREKRKISAITCSPRTTLGIRPHYPCIYR